MHRMQKHCPETHQSDSAECSASFGLIPCKILGFSHERAHLRITYRSGLNRSIGLSITT
jgi:hypothetical protein